MNKELGLRLVAPLSCSVRCPAAPSVTVPWVSFLIGYKQAKNYQCLPLQSGSFWGAGRKEERSNGVLFSFQTHTIT